MAVNSFARSYTLELWSFSITLVLYLVSLAVYRLLFSPLTSFPGPKIWALTRLPYIISLLRGNLAHDVRRIHEKYGEAVRIAPNEVSFATPDAWQDIFATRSGRNPFGKNPMWYKPPPGQVWSLISTPDPAAHARMLGLLNEAFTDKALHNQEYIIQSYVDLLISRLHEKASSGVSINIVDWLNYMTFDIIGDLAFGEPFDCLKNNVYHPWVSMVFDSIRIYSLAVAARYYPLVETALMMLVPKSVRQRVRAHHQLCVARTHRRLNMEKQRYDFIAPIIESNKDMDKMSLSEIESTFSMLIIAGSETTATALSGITYRLTQNPLVMQALVSEIRDTFQEEKDMTIDSVRALPYLNAVISEGLRVCNPAPAGLPRLVPPEGDTVCGLWLPGKTHVSVHPYTIYNSPHRFHQPESFVPERWLPYPSCPTEYASDQLSAVRPFSLGPRRCLGQKLALFEMQLVLARLAWAFKMEAVQGSSLDWGSLKTFVVVQKRPFMVRLKTRVIKS